MRVLWSDNYHNIRGGSDAFSVMELSEKMFLHALSE